MKMRIALLSVVGTCLVSSSIAFMPATPLSSLKATSATLPNSRLLVVTDPVETKESSSSDTDSAPAKKSASPPFSRIMAANRAEIAVRIMRAATELNAGTVAIYVHEDRYSQHREF